MEMTKTSKKKARLAALGLIVSLGLVVALVSIVLTDAQGKDGGDTLVRHG